MSEPIYKRKGARVYGKGHSYNCTNNITAIELCEQLNCYETQNTTNIQLQKIDEKLTQIHKDIREMKNENNNHR